MVVNIPSDFKNDQLYEYIEADNITLLKYKSYSSKQKVYAYNDSSLLIFIMRGKKIVQCADQQFEAKQGELLFIKKGNYIMNQIADLDEGRYECLIICLNDNLIDQFYKTYHAYITKIYTETASSKERFKQTLSEMQFKEIENLLMYFTSNTVYTKEIIKLKIYQILLNIMSQMPVPYEMIEYFQETGCSHRITFKRFMEENFDRPYSVKQFADAVGMSLTSFKKSFKSEFKDTPKSWVNIKRLQKACSLLSSTDYNITEICYLIGFEDLSYFTRLFKKVYGISPSTYRRQL